MSIQLKVGKKYRNRIGQTVKIVEYSPSCIYGFYGENSSSYTINGYLYKEISNHPGNLIEQLPDEEDNMREADILSAINALPICDDGKRGVRELVSKLHPELKLEANAGLKAGQVYLCTISGNSGYRLIVGADNRLKSVDIRDGIVASDYVAYIERWISKGTYRLAANSLPEFLEMYKRGEVSL